MEVFSISSPETLISWEETNEKSPLVNLIRPLFLEFFRCCLLDGCNFLLFFTGIGSSAARDLADRPDIGPWAADAIFSWAIDYHFCPPDRDQGPPKGPLNFLGDQPDPHLPYSKIPWGPPLLSRIILLAMGLVPPPTGWLVFQSWPETDSGISDSSSMSFPSSPSQWDIVPEIPSSESKSEMSSELHSDASKSRIMRDRLWSSRTLLMDTFLLTETGWTTEISSIFGSYSPYCFRVPRQGWNTF